MKYLYATLFTIIATNASAIDCNTIPDCISLGYSKNDVDGCNEDEYIYCPLDNSYKKCIKAQLDCASLGFTTDDKSSWCGSIITCPTDTSYTACTNLDCSGYTNLSCSDLEATHCDECINNSGTFYKAIVCKDGYIKTSSNSTGCTQTYNSCEEANLKSADTFGMCAGSTTNYKPSGEPMTCYYGCPTCEYLYDTATYPNVRETKYNDSCVRGGVTYYREVCSGTSESDCDGCLTTTCTTYNGNDYGTCSPMPAKGCGHEFTFEVTLEHNDASASANNCRQLHPTTSMVFTAVIHKDGEEYAIAQVRATGNDFSEALRLSNFQNVMPTANFSKNIPNGTYDFYITMDVTGNGSGNSIKGLPDLRKVSAAGTAISSSTMCTPSESFNVCNLGSIEVSDRTNPYSVQLLVGTGCDANFNN